MAIIPSHLKRDCEHAAQRFIQYHGIMNGVTQSGSAWRLVSAHKRPADGKLSFLLVRQRISLALVIDPTGSYTKFLHCPSLSQDAMS